MVDLVRKGQTRASAAHAIKVVSGHPTGDVGVNIRFAGRGPGAGGLHIDRFNKGHLPDGQDAFRFHWDKYASANVTGVVDAFQNTGTMIQHILFESLAHSAGQIFQPIQGALHWTYQNQSMLRGRGYVF